jgi:hypothetical protein
MFLREECCYYVNQTGQVEEYIKTLQKIAFNIRQQYPNITQAQPFGFWSPVLTWIIPLLGPLAAIFSLLLSIPCLFKCLQDLLRAQQTDFSPDATTALSGLPTTGLIFKWGLRETAHLQSQGISYIPARPSLKPSLSRKQPDQLAHILPTKGWNVRSLASWGGQKIPRLSLKPGSLAHNCLQNPPACKTTENFLFFN